jgi:sensor histidine kinase YesM
LVENAIRHGIYPQKQGGTVKVLAELNEDRIMLVVEDDGVGMDEAAVSRVLEYDSGRKTIGLCNVNSRLKSMYGDGFGIKIASSPGKGTRVSISIPYGRT